jgi:hypothetical protein
MSSNLRLWGVSRVEDNEQVLSMHFDRRPTDAEMTAIHEHWRQFSPETPAPRAHIGDADGWVPVTNSLPTHGRKVIAYYLNDLGKGRTVFAKHIEKFKDCADDYDIDADVDEDWFDMDESGTSWVPEGWYEETETHEQCLKLSNEVTHWRPMPKAPEQVKTSAPPACETHGVTACDSRCCKEPAK